MNTKIFESSNWNDVTNEGRNNLIFENKNRIYGAYFIRREYNNNVIAAMLLTLSSFLCLSLIPYYYNSFAQKSNEVVIPTIDDGIIVEIVKPIEPIEIPSTPVSEIKKEVSSQNNLPPIVTDNVLETTTIIPNEAIVNPGKETKIGDPLPIDLDKIVETKTTLGENTDFDKVFIQVEEMPEFPGGENAMFEFLNKQIIYPLEAKELGIKGTVYLHFIIDKNGKVTNVTVAKGIRGGTMLDNEALRVISAMPTWSIGRQNGHPVSVSYNLPVSFNLR